MYSKFYGNVIHGFIPLIADLVFKGGAEDLLVNRAMARALLGADSGLVQKGGQNASVDLFFFWLPRNCFNVDGLQSKYVYCPDMFGIFRCIHRFRLGGK